MQVAMKGAGIARATIPIVKAKVVAAIVLVVKVEEVARATLAMPSLFR
jgi:hypothetical protein